MVLSGLSDNTNAAFSSSYERIAVTPTDKYSSFVSTTGEAFLGRSSYIYTRGRPLAMKYPSIDIPILSDAAASALHVYSETATSFVEVY